MPDALRYKTTRFITYVKRFQDRHTDPDMLAFAQWLFQQPYASSNMHAGVEQLTFFIQAKKPADAVKQGFVKWCMVYQKDPVNLLPNHLKNNPELLIHVAGIVFLEDSELEVE